jgi:hypothetical protein
MLDFVGKAKLKNIRPPCYSSMSIFYPISGYQTTFRQSVNCGDYVFLEKSPCGAEGEEKARYPQELVCLSDIILIIPCLVSQIKAGVSVCPNML